MSYPLLAVRVHPWQLFRFRKYAQKHGIHLGQLATEMIQEYLAQPYHGVPKAELEKWLAEYHETQKN